MSNPCLSITKEFSFESSHVLPWHQGKCGRLHGHSYKLFVTISGKLDANGIIMDFADLKVLVNTYIIDKLDHQHLNEIISNPSGEAIALWIWARLFATLKHHCPFVTLEEIKLYETATAYVTVRKEP